VSQVGRNSGQLWEQVDLAIHARSGVLFSLVGGAPLLHRRNVITIHDAAVFAAPKSFSRAFRLWYQFLYWTLCHTALHVLTVSEFSRTELMKYCGIKPGNISVTYLGSEHALRPTPQPAVLDKHRLKPFRYVLAVGSRNPSKNIPGLVKAVPYLAETDFDLAIAGQSYSNIFGESHISGDRVRDLGYVDDSELRSLYENAACFVFPSFYEGFGLPPLEALALGCPAVVANANSLAELFPGVAFLCDPRDPADIAAKILLACQAPAAERTRYRAFAAGFGWEKCAALTWSVLARVAES
jgi:glycosyltransferase involved in cell wall biosynthesis